MRAALVIACLLSLSVVSRAESYDLVIRHGRVVDGTGNPAFFADLAVKDARIAAIGQIESHAKTEIDATGMMVAPGFIDVHTHADDVADAPDAQNFLRMGVTTLMVGNCGGSNLEVGKFFRDIDGKHISINAATLIGHNTVREDAMGGDFDRSPTVEEMGKMKTLVDQAMKDGAVAMSTGLIYLPGVFSKTDEIVELAKIVAAFDGIYASHMRRHEDSRIFRALDEVFQVAQNGHVHAEVSHIKLSGERAWGQSNKVLESIEKARSEGLDITQDIYAYTASSTGLRQTIPDWAFNGGRKQFLEILKDPAQKAKLVEDMKKRIHALGREDYAYAVVASNERDRWVSPVSWQQTSAPSESWTSVASSADGSRLVAAASGPIYTSTDSGVSWQQTSAPLTNWAAVASSAEGTRLVAVVDGGLIYNSTNAGGTWTATTAPNRQWKSVACSGDGIRQVAVYAQGFLDGGIYLSTNSGGSWSLASAPTNGWYSVASSADGTKLAAMTTDSLTPAGPYGWIYVSAEAGRTWTQSARVQWPTSLASSADGTRLVAAIGEQGFTFSGSLMLSTDSGATWAGALTNAPIHVWSSAATSADGTRLAVGTGGVFSSQIVGPIYTTADSGLTWSTLDSPVEYWTALAMSADSGKVVAAAKDDGIYTLQTTPSPSLSITVSGGKVMISWTIPSMSFELQQNSNLTGTNWTPVETVPSLSFTNLHNQVTVPAIGNSAFYRLKGF